MHPSSRWVDPLLSRIGSGRDERGSASLEFITVGILMLVPLVYLVITLGQIQGQAMGVEAGARHIARAIAMAADAPTASERVDTVIRSVTQEYGLDPDAVAVAVSCVPADAQCPQAGSTLIVTVATSVPLPLAPDIFEWDELLRVPIEADAAQKVSRLWGAG